MVVAGLSVYHDTLESEMQVIPNGQSNYSGDMSFKVSGELKDTDNGKVYDIDNGRAYQSLLFIMDDKIYSTLRLIFNNSSGDMFIEDQQEIVWLDAENLAPEGSIDKGMKTVRIGENSFECNVYEYISPETGQNYTYYIGINTSMIYRIDCQIHGFSQIESEQTITDISATANIDYSSFVKGKYEFGEIGDVQTIHMKGEEKVHMSGDMYDDWTTNNYFGNIDIKTVSNTKYLTNAYLNSYGMYKEITLNLNKNSNLDDPYLKIYVPCAEGGRLGDGTQYEWVNDKIVGMKSTYYNNFSYMDKNLTRHSVNYTITSEYDEDGKTLEKITIEGYEYISTYDWTIPHPSETRFIFESTGVSS